MRSLLALLAGLALGVAFTGYSADQARGDLALERARCAEAESRVGASCEPVYQVHRIEFDCPPFIGSTLPESVKPVVCAPRVRVYRVETAAKALREMRPGDILLEERGVREKVLKVEWKPEVR